MDAIANMLTKIRNAQAAGHESVLMSHSKMKEKIAKILEKEDFVGQATVVKGDKTPQIKIILREDRILALKRISKPGQRIYVKNNKIKKVRNGLGMSIISTSQGIMTNKEARQKKIGGELICSVF